MKIGNLTLKHGLFLGPMAGYTDYGMREVCKRLGAEYLVTEMVSAKAVTYGDKKSCALARFPESQSPCAIQIFGKEPSVMAEAARMLSEGAAGGCAPAAIDINMGCPVPKLFGNGEGSALMASPSLIFDIVSAVVNAVKLPVTVKIRSGIDDKRKNAVECAKAAEAAGAALIAVHGRTRVQMYSGLADREIIKNVKNSVQIPVIGNGDINTAADALSMIQETGVDGVMIARGAMNNPMIFAEILKTPNAIPIKEEMLKHLKLLEDRYGEERTAVIFRKQMAFYLKGYKDSKKLKEKVFSSKRSSEIREVILSL